MTNDTHDPVFLFGARKSLSDSPLELSVEQRHAETASGPTDHNRIFATRSYLIAMALALTLPVVLIAGYLAHRFNASENARIESTALNHARVATFAIERELQGVVTSLQILAESNSLVLSDLAEFHRYAVRIAGNLDANIGLRDLDSRQIVNSGVPWGQPLPNRTSLASVDQDVLRTGRPAVSDFFVGIVDARQSIAVVVPVMRDGRTVAFLAAGFGVERIRAAARSALPDNWSVQTVDRGGTIITHKQRPDLTGSAIADPLRIVLAQPEGIWRGIGDSGGSEIAAWQRTGDGWTVIAGLDAAVARADIAATMTLIGTGAVAMLLLGVACALALSRRISGPISTLAAMGTALGRGERVSPRIFGNTEANLVASALVSASHDLAAREETQRLANAFVAGQKDAMERAMAGASIGDVLDILVGAAAQRLKTRVAMFRVDKSSNTLRFVAHRGLAAAYVAAIDGFAISMDNPACGMVAFCGRPAIEPDIEKDPRWLPYMALAREHSIRASWSLPIKNSADDVIGTFAVYHAVPSTPDLAEIEVLGLVVQTASVLIERLSAEELRRANELALRESELRYRSALRAGRIGAWETDFVTRTRIWSDEGMELFGLTLPGGVGQVGGENDEWVASIEPGDHVTALNARRMAHETDSFQVEYRIRRPDGQMLWVAGAGYVTQRDASGTVERMINVVADITERKLAQDRLLASEARFRASQETSMDGFMLLAAIRDDAGAVRDFEIGYANHAADLILQKASGWGVGKQLTALFPTIRETGLFARFLRVFDTGEPWQAEIDHPHDGNNVFLRLVVARTSDGIALTFADISARKLAELRQQASEARFRAVQETSIDGFMLLRAIRDGSGRIVDFSWTYVNDAAAHLISRPRDWFFGRRMLVEMPGNRDAGLFDAYVRVVESGEPWEREIEYKHDGIDVYLRVVLAKTDDGFAVTMSDLSERRRAEQHRTLLINELNHRVKNTLATVQSIAAQSFKANSEAVPAVQTFQQRILSLSRAHDVLTHESWDGASMSEIALATLTPWLGGADAERFRIGGDDIRLKPQPALAVSMALHELATNAAKYGALSSADGRVTLGWRLVDGVVSIDWRERDGPPVQPPERRGFGSRLLTRALQAELDGDVRLTELSARSRSRFTRLTTPCRIQTWRRSRTSQRRTSCQTFKNQRILSRRSIEARR